MMAGAQWVRLDVGYFTNPKVLRVGRDGAVMHLAAICYLGAHRIDTGLLPPEAVDVVARQAHIRRSSDVLDRLVAHGLWHPSMTGGYVVHDYDTTNGHASPVASARERQRRHRANGDGEVEP